MRNKVFTPFFKSLNAMIALFCAAFFCLQTNLMAQNQTGYSLDKYLLTMPDSIMPSLNRESRQKLFVDSLSNIQNSFGTDVTLLREGNLYTVYTSDVGHVQMKLFPIENGDSVICVVTTVSSPVKDSRMNFYTTEWQLLPLENFWQNPQFEDFILPNTDKSSYSYQATYKSFNPLFFEIVLSSKEDVLYVSQNVDDILGEEEKVLVSVFLKKEPLCYRWKSGHFIRDFSKAVQGK